MNCVRATPQAPLGCALVFPLKKSTLRLAQKSKNKDKRCVLYNRPDKPCVTLTGDTGAAHIHIQRTAIRRCGLWTIM